jgi:AcrR family transcriptional regulator
MATQRSSSPRRKPRQERAKVTVDAILEAAAHILVSSGYEGTTTKEVAERAGVSIGSLYQYFPSKEALVAALAERTTQQVLNAVIDKMIGPPEGSLEEVTRATVELLVGLHAASPKLQRVLLEQVPRIGPLRVIEELERRLESLIRTRLSRVAKALRPRNLDLAVFLLTRALRGTIWATVIERPETMDEPELVEELYALVIGYLRP